MKSIKNHLSLIIALLSILFSIQVFTIVDRAIEAYKVKLSQNYSIVAVTQVSMSEKNIKNISSLISSVDELKPDGVIKRLASQMDKRNMELLKVALPKFYRLKLTHYPSPDEITLLTKNLLADPAITKIENFATNHDTTYKLLLLFKDVISIFALSILIVTTLLILKELRIWQYTHNERMNIMGLFGSPIWLSSAVLFRLAIVDAIVSSILTFMVFTYISSTTWLTKQLDTVGIDIMIFDQVGDFSILFGVAMVLSIVLAVLIVLGHKEEV
jgi:cell division transport system permease protein